MGRAPGTGDERGFRRASARAFSAYTENPQARNFGECAGAPRMFDGIKSGWSLGRFLLH